MITVTPNAFANPADLFGDLLDGIDFVELPIDLINAALHKAAAVIEVIPAADPAIAGNVAAAALEHVRIAEELIGRWWAQSVRGAAGGAA